MKIFYISLSFLLINPVLFSQIKIDASTDKQIYQYGDTVQINVIVTNTSEEIINLGWGSACQSNYYIDEYSLIMHITCTASLTSLTLQPGQSYTWSFKHPSYLALEPALPVGLHKIVGEVLGYGKSDTLEITVTDITNVINQNKLPLNFHLQQNYPNPFNPSTIIKYEIPVEGYLTIKIYDVLGNEVATIVDMEKPEGVYEIEFDASNLSSGIYFYVLNAGGKTLSKKMCLLK